MKAKMFFVFFLSVMVSNFAYAKNITSDSEPVRWSLRAYADTISEIHKYYCKTDLPELVKMSDFIYDNPTASIQEISNVCRNTEPVLTRELRLGETIDKVCVGQDVGDGCAHFIKVLKQKQNEIVAQQRGSVFSTPGTYVIRLADNIYRVYDAVPGVGRKIYIVQPNPDGSVSLTGEVLPIETATDDMFVNKSDVGMRGTFLNSYIFTNIDFSDKVYERYNYLRGIPVAYGVGAALGGWSDGANDVKNWSEVQDIKIVAGDNRVTQNKNWIKEQEKNDAHTNGFIFNGQIAHAEWIGHFLVGMTRSESGVSHLAANQAVYLEEDVKRKNFAQAAEHAVIGAVAEIGDVISLGNIEEKLGVAESGDYAAHNYNDVAQAGANMQKMLTHFNKTQTKVPAEAESMAAQFLRTQNVCAAYGNAVKCYARECNKAPATQDFVDCYCVSATHVKFVMEFDDMCN